MVNGTPLTRVSRPLWPGECARACHPGAVAASSASANPAGSFRLKISTRAPAELKLSLTWGLAGLEDTMPTSNGESP